MKLTRSFQHIKPTAIALALAGSIAAGIAQPYASYIADQFDTDTSSSFDNNYWGQAVPVITWDGTQNAITALGPNNPGSGALSWDIPWPEASGDQFMVTRGFPNGAILNLNQYTNVSFDIKFPATCGTDGAGSYGDVEVGVTPQSDGWPSTALGVYVSAVANGNDWIHVSMPINAASNPKLSAVSGYYFKMQQSRTGGNLTNTTFWVDNVIFGGLDIQPPPPTLSIARNTSPAGLMVVCGGSGGTYTRGLMMAFDPINSTRNFSWVGTATPTTPVTYSQTIVSYPDPTHPIQSAIFLVQNGQFGDPGVDYDAANVAQLSLYANTNGTATASFQYKTNQADGNSQFGANTLATLTAPSALGLWSVTFSNDLNLTLSYVPLTGGAGLSTNASFPDETTVQTYFANPLSVFMGNQQNADANLGQSSTYSQFAISGVTASPAIIENWTNQQTMDTTNWGKVDYATGDILLVHATDKYWVDWTIPDSGFTMVASSNLTSGWVNVSLSQVVNTTAGNRALLPGLAANFPAGNSAYFKLVKRTATQLQVLLPGETNAPGTATGKIGTPTPVAAGDPVTVTVNAVDSQWNIVGVTGDAIYFTASDGSVDAPANATLVSGTAQSTAYFNSDGSGFTITAQDTSNGSIADGTSSPETVNN